jgi:hypothetical protein
VLRSFLTAGAAAFLNSSFYFTRRRCEIFAVVPAATPPSYCLSGRQLQQVNSTGPDIIAIVEAEASPSLWRQVLKNTPRLRHHGRTMCILGDLASSEIDNAHGIRLLAWPLLVVWISKHHDVLAVEISMRHANSMHGRQAVE